MSSIDELARDAAELSDHEKLALANAIWDQEIRNRARAYDETRPSTRAAGDVRCIADLTVYRGQTISN